MTEGRQPTTEVHKEGIKATSSGIGPIPDANGTGTYIDIGRISGNGDWLFVVQSPDPEHQMISMRFPSTAGGGDSDFVNDELFVMLQKFLDKPSTMKFTPELDSINAPYGSFEVGEEGDDFELDVTGIQGMGVYGELYGHIHRFLNIRILKDGSVQVTLENREDEREDDEPRPTPEEIEAMPLKAATVTLRPDGSFPYFAEAFANIARRAAAAIQRDIEFYTALEDLETDEQE